jgi:hypothetical protein
MVNSPRMHFNTTRLKPEVGLENNYILGYKKHLDRFIYFTK